MTNEGLLWEAYKDIVKSGEMMSKTINVSANDIREIRLVAERATHRLLELERRLLGNEPPKCGD